jgi:hypothetical protein
VVSGSLVADEAPDVSGLGCDSDRHPLEVNIRSKMVRTCKVKLSVLLNHSVDHISFAEARKIVAKGRGVFPVESTVREADGTSGSRPIHNKEPYRYNRVFGDGEKEIVPRN